MPILVAFRMGWQESMKALFCSGAKAHRGLAAEWV